MIIETKEKKKGLGNPISYRLQKELEDVLIAVATANNLSPGAFSRQCVESVLKNIEYAEEKKEDKKIDYDRFIGLYVSSFLYTMLNVLAEAKNKKIISLVREVLENYIKTELEIK